MAIVFWYGVAAVALGYIVQRGRDMRDSEEFLYARRESGTLQSAFSIAATWVWAPALFVSAEQAYINGLTGWLWFFIPNVLTILLFSRYAVKVYQAIPDSKTLPDYMRSIYGDRVHGLYLVQFLVLQVASFAVQLLAGGAIISGLTGVPYPIIVVVFAAIAFTYSAVAGMRASIVTDTVQMVIMILAGTIAAVAAVTTYGVGAISLGGVSGLYANPLSSDGLHVAFVFGIATAIGLFAGPFGDQTFWQRVFSQPVHQVKKSFLLAAGVFAIVPITFGILGAIGAGAGIETQGSQLVNIATVNSLGRPALSAFVVVAIIAGLGSTMDSNMVAVASLWKTDIVPRSRTGRESMVALLLLGVALALVPGIKIVHLFLFYGTLRAATFIPTLRTIQGYRVEQRVFWGVLMGLLLGAPVLAFGKFAGSDIAAFVGAVASVGVPAISVMGGGKSE